MPRLELNDTWSIDIDETFGARVVDGDLQLVSPGPPPRSIWIAMWSPPDGMATDDVVAMIRGDLHPNPEESFDECDAAGNARLASWYAETVDDRTHWGLYGYTLSADAFLQSAFLVPDESFLSWALDAWRSLNAD